MKLLIFGKPTCEICHKVKNKLEYFSKKEFPIPIEYFDVESVDGMAQSAFWGINEIPTVILLKDKTEIKRWEQSAPLFSELKTLLNNESR
ncbi:MAG: thioredoxin family protein [candidate division WOR-3 bacterium]|nr:thioredoxin family protein [candidate division WOR-3 bacterium]